ncbi:MAG TPA: GGDEF domain-containing protein [Candidatus Polarisedimenticolaceae bacterium]|nr:GGDEF domain-containing protein [Candidatus Polarisedimenticolaceae bacterium]
MRRTNPEGEGSLGEPGEAVSVADRRRLAALLADPRLDGARLLARLREARTLDRIASCSSIIETLCGIRLAEAAAERLIVELVEHREQWIRRVGRDPGLAVVAMDRLVEGADGARNPVAVELSELDPGGTTVVPDPLTGLNHRRFLEAALWREIRRSGRSRIGFSVVVADLDGFRSVNELYGHPLGDRVLGRAGRTVRRTVRESDTAWRLDADQFAVLLPEGRRLGAWGAAERLRAAVEADFLSTTIDDRIVVMTVSCGVACYPDDGTTPDDLLAAARCAVSRAKMRGANRVMIHPRERRRSVRLAARPTARARLGAGSIRELHDVRLIDLGRNGALVETDADVPGDEPLLLVLESVGRSTMVHCRLTRTESDSTARRLAVLFAGQLERRTVAEFGMAAAPADGGR